MKTNWKRFMKAAVIAGVMLALVLLTTAAAKDPSADYLIAPV